MPSCWGVTASVNSTRFMVGDREIFTGVWGDDATIAKMWIGARAPILRSGVPYSAVVAFATASLDSSSGKSA